MDELSFWQLPDWKKESTLNPNFIMVIIVALFIVCGITLCSFAYREHLPIKNDVRVLKNKISARKDKVNTLKKLQSQNRQITSKIEILNNNRKPIAWSPQLAALARNLPENIVFRRLTIQAERITVEKTVTVDDKKQTREIPKIRYRMLIQGRALGKDARQKLSSFSEKLQDAPPMSQTLESAELPQVRERTNDRNETYFSFKMACIYNPM